MRSAPVRSRVAGSATTGRRGAPRRALGLGALLTAGLLAAPVSSAGAAPDPSPAAAPSGWSSVTADLRPVLVRARPGRLSAAAAAVSRAGGRVGARHAALDTLAAQLPSGARTRVLADPAVLSLTDDVTVRLAADEGASSPAPGQLRHLGVAIGLTRLHEAGITGAGVDVAILDSGVSPVEGLHDPAALVHGPDLTPESQSPALRHLDSYGHGTHLAGLIAGDDGPAGDEDSTPRFTGVAPGARLVSVKVADGSGATDVSQVIAGIDWVVQHRRADGLDIRVLTLAFGTDSRMDVIADPLVHAAEVAWAHGIVVVVSAGNGGTATGRNAPGLRHPAASPVVLAVGATDTLATDAPGDDVVATYSSSGQGGKGSRNPDLIAPGTGLDSLRVPGSRIDEAVPGDGGRYLRGSGTSQAAAVTSGAVALLLQHRPALTPDQVKKLLQSTARPLSGASKERQGAGTLDLGRAVTAATPSVTSAQVRADGTGPLDLARGTVRVVRDGVVLSGERDLMGAPWSANSAPVRARAEAWSGGRWNGSTWTGGGFDTTTLSSRSWSTVGWTSESWTGTAWTGLASRSWSSSGWSSGSWGAPTTDSRGLGEAAWGSAEWVRP